MQLLQSVTKRIYQKKEQVELARVRWRGSVVGSFFASFLPHKGISLESHIFSIFPCFRVSILVCGDFIERRDLFWVTLQTARVILAGVLRASSVQWVRSSGGNAEVQQIPTCHAHLIRKQSIC